MPLYYDGAPHTRHISWIHTDSMWYRNANSPVMTKLHKIYLPTALPFQLPLYALFTCIYIHREVANRLLDAYFTFGLSRSRICMSDITCLSLTIIVTNTHVYKIFTRWKTGFPFMRISWLHYIPHSSHFHSGNARHNSMGAEFDAHCFDFAGLFDAFDGSMMMAFAGRFCHRFIDLSPLASCFLISWLRDWRTKPHRIAFPPILPKMTNWHDFAHLIQPIYEMHTDGGQLPAAMRISLGEAATHI